MGKVDWPCRQNRYYQYLDVIQIFGRSIESFNDFSFPIPRIWQYELSFIEKKQQQKKQKNKKNKQNNKKTTTTNKLTKSPTRGEQLVPTGISTICLYNLVPNLM